MDNVEITTPEIVAAKLKMQEAVRAVEAASDSEKDAARETYLAARTAYREAVSAAFERLLPT